MRKVIFLFLLFPLIYGAVSVNAQVRIGGNSTPHSSAVLDLNPDNTASAKGGFLLPRVRLDSVEHAAVFSAGTVPSPGLMIYNTNEVDTDTRYFGKGVYLWDGNEWLFLGGKSLKNIPYEGIPFEILGQYRSLWLGRDGKSAPQVEFSLKLVSGETMSVEELSEYRVKYTWYFVDPAVGSTIVDSAVTLEPRPKLPDGQKIKKGKVYRLDCRMSLLGHTTGRSLVGTAVYGIGAWTGEGRWLNVANANAGANQSLDLNDQLKEDHWSDYNRTVMGDRFQWGRFPDGHQYMKSGTYNGVVSVNQLHSQTGVPLDVSDVFGKFVLSNGDWREYANTSCSQTPRRPWYWRTMEYPAEGVDPCGMNGFSGEWFVMTKSQWDSIRKYNRLARLNSELVGGVAVYPNGDSNISFYFPTGGGRDAATGQVVPSNLFEDETVNATINLWLNSYETGNCTEAYCLNWPDNMGTNVSATLKTRSFGYPVRCVSDSF